MEIHQTSNMMTFVNTDTVKLTSLLFNVLKETLLSSTYLSEFTVITDSQ